MQLTDVWMIAQTDLRVSWRSRSLSNYVVPFLFTTLLLFGLTLDPDRGALERAGGGLFWMIALFASVLLAQQRGFFASRSAEMDSLRMASVDPAAVFLGKCLAMIVQLLALEALLALGVIVFYGVSFTSIALFLGAMLLGAAALSAVNTACGFLLSASRNANSLFFVVFLPLVAPVLLASARITEVAMQLSSDNASLWLQLLAAFCVAYIGLGILVSTSVMEE